MNKKIYFATTNENKIREVENILEIEVEGCGLSIEEIQSLDPERVALEKAKAYYKSLKKPILVEDVSLVFTDFGNLPGTYIDSFYKELGNNGLIELLLNKKNRKAIAQTTLVYIDDQGNEEIFVGQVKGEISESPKGELGFGWDPIFVPEGETRTFGEMVEKDKAKYSMRAQALKKLKDWMNNQ